MELVSTSDILASIGEGSGAAFKSVWGLGFRVWGLGLRGEGFGDCGSPSVDSKSKSKPLPRSNNTQMTNSFESRQGAGISVLLEGQQMVPWPLVLM